MPRQKVRSKCMSNSDLQATLNNINSQISRIRAENARIQSELTALANSARSGSINLINTSENAKRALENNRTTIDYSHSQLKKTFNVQLQIKEMYFIFKDVETANKKIRALTNKLYFDYRNQSTVRKIVRGFMDNLDLNMVKDETIYKSLEKQFIQEPNYWLAYVLLAIMYWKSDNAQKAEQCIQNAVEKNKKSTSIFFMLFNLKLNRVQPAIKWFKFYQECEQVGNDSSTFLMFISSLPNRINDENLKSEIDKLLIEYIGKEVEEDKTEVNEEDIVKIIFNYLNHLGQVEGFKYNLIRQYLKESQVMMRSMQMAKANEDVLKYIEDLNKVHIGEKNIFLTKYIDDLVSIPSEDEQKIIDEIKYNEEIISSMEPLKHMDDEQIFNSGAFKKLAEENHRMKMEHDYGKLNVVNEIINWVYINKNNDINSLTKWNLFALTKDYTDQAYTTYYNTYQQMLPKKFTISINDYISQTDFSNLDRQLSDKEHFIENKTKRLLATVKDSKAILGIVFGAILLACFVATLTLGFIFKNKEQMLGFLFFFIAVITLVFGVVLFVKGLITKLVTNPKKRRQIKENMAKESSHLEEVIIKLFDEMKSFMIDFKEADQVSEYVRERIKQI